MIQQRRKSQKELHHPNMTTITTRKRTDLIQLMMDSFVLESELKKECDKLMKTTEEFDHHCDQQQSTTTSTTKTAFAGKIKKIKNNLF